MLETTLFYYSYSEISSSIDGMHESTYFHDVELKVDIGEFEIGDEFECVSIDLCGGEIELFDGEHFHTYELELKVGKPLRKEGVWE